MRLRRWPRCDASCRPGPAPACDDGLADRRALAGPRRRRRRAVAAARPRASLTWLRAAGSRCARVSPLVRAQTAVVVAFATVVEYVFSPTLEVYTYRFDNVPAYVPPGHGLVYLSAFALGPRRVRRAAPACVRSAAVLVVGGAWAAYGVLLADRPDALGAFWFACLVAVPAVRARRSRSTSAPSWSVSWLELARHPPGHLGVGQPHDPTGWVSIGNPPSGRRAATAGSTWPRCCRAAPAARLARSGQLGPSAAGSACGGRRRALRSCTDPCRARRDVGVVLVVGQRAEERQRLVVQPAVAGQRVAAGRAGRAVERGERAAGLAHDHVERGHVVELELRLGGEVDGALGDAACRTRSRRTPGCASSAGTAPGSRRAGPRSSQPESEE